MYDKLGNMKFDEAHHIFSSLYDAYWKKVLHFTRLYLTDAYEQEEVVQEAFIRLWEMRSRIDDVSNIDGLLFIITRNLIFDRHRRSLNEIALKQDLASVVEEEYDIEGQIDAVDLREYIDKLIALLPERQRQAFVLSRYHYMSIREIAGKMNISERGVERNIYLALKFLRKHLPMFIVFMECACRQSRGIS